MADKKKRISAKEELKKASDVLVSKFLSRSTVAIDRNIRDLEKLQKARTSKGLARMADLDTNIEKLKKFKAKLEAGEMNAVRYILSLLSLAKIILSTALIIYSIYHTFKSGTMSLLWKSIMASFSAIPFFTSDLDKDKSVYNLKSAAVFSLSPAISKGVEKVTSLAAKTANKGPTNAQAMTSLTSTVALASASVFVLGAMVSGLTELLIGYYAGTITVETLKAKSKNTLENGVKKFKEAMRRLASLFRINLARAERQKQKDRNSKENPKGSKHVRRIQKTHTSIG